MMKSFDYIATNSLSDVTTLLRRYATKARLLDGDTDLLLRLERRLVKAVPEATLTAKSRARKLL